MSGDVQAAQGPELYTGSVRVPGTDQAVGISLGVDLGAPSVSVDLAEPVAGARRWGGDSVTVRRLLKYDEVHFTTEGLPVDGVVLQWKTNVSRVDGSVAGVIIARPNASRVSGEIGFILSRECPGK